MNLEEYEKIKSFTYLEYCDYLQNKYGFCKKPYMTENFNKTQGISRTKEGLLIHHKYEDHAILLSTPAYAANNPYEYQMPENLIFCDYLEHLFLHILICEYPAEDKNEDEDVGIGGVLSFLVPELNDVYSGFQTTQLWRKCCYDKIINDKDVYIMLVRRFIQDRVDKGGNIEICAKMVLSSFNASYHLWDDKNNVALWEEIVKPFYENK